MFHGRWQMLISTGVVISSVVSTLTFAQLTGGDYEISKSTIDGGGVVAAAGAFSLTGTIGQPDADPNMSRGGEYSAAGGFWANAIDLVFADGFEND